MLDRYRLIEEVEEFRCAGKTEHELHMAWVPSHGNVPTGKRETWVENMHTDEKTARARNQCADERCTDERRRPSHLSSEGRIVLKKQHNGLPMPFAQQKTSWNDMWVFSAERRWRTSEILRMGSTIAL